MVAASKDTIYIDIDDEITSIIEKLRASEHKIVALVLPKRATMLQSSVNMKLLKRTADSTKKQIVLITSEVGLMPLMASVGLHVAKSLQSKPEIPEVVNEGEESITTNNLDAADLDDVDDTKDENDFDSKAASDKPIGELAGLAETDKAEETIDLDNSELDKPAALTNAEKKAAKKKLKSSPKVPDFEKFRLRLIIGVVVLILLVVGWIMAATILPKATITVDTDTSRINSNLTINLDPAAITLDSTKLVVPAKLQQTQKVVTQQVSATGQKNQGTKATGTVTLSLTDCSQSSVTVPAGTGVSTNGLTFITQASATLNSVKVGNQCKNSQFPSFTSADVNVTSQQAGSQYNVGASTFTVAGFFNVQGSSANPMSGGTDNNIKVVSQNDIDNAKQKLATQDSSAVKTELQNDLQTAGFYAINSTFNTQDPTIKSNANAGDQTDTVTVTQTTTYIMLGVQKGDLQKLIDADVTKQIDASKQAILDDGISAVSFTVVSQSPANAQLTMQTTATAGPHLDVNSLKQQIAGKKSGEIETIIGANPGVTSVTVHFSPFWVDTTPKKANKVTIQFVKTSQSKANGS